jgi:hypothetical protein
LNDVQVIVDYCPLHEASYSTERFLDNWFGHYRNQHLMMPILETPAWINEGVTILSFIYNKLQNELSQERSNNVLKDRIYR